MTSRKQKRSALFSQSSGNNAAKTQRSGNRVPTLKSRPLFLSPANPFAARESRQPALTKSRCDWAAFPANAFAGAGRRFFLAANDSPGSRKEVYLEGARNPQQPATLNGEWYLFFSRDNLNSERSGTAVVKLNAQMRPVDESYPVVLPGLDWQIFERGRPLDNRVSRAWHTVEGAQPVVSARALSVLLFGGNGQNVTRGVTYAVASRSVRNRWSWV